MYTYTLGSKKSISKPISKGLKGWSEKEELVVEGTIGWPGTCGLISNLEWTYLELIKL